MGVPVLVWVRLYKYCYAIMNIITSDGRTFNSIRFNYCGVLSTFVIIITYMSIDIVSLHIVS